MFNPNGLTVGRGKVYNSAGPSSLAQHYYLSQDDNIATIATVGYFPDYLGQSDEDVNPLDLITIVDSNLDTFYYQITIPSPLTIILLSAGNGDIVGPNSSVIGDVPIFSDTTGKLVADSGVNIDGSRNISNVAKITATSVATPILDTANAAILTIGPSHATAVSITPPISTFDDISIDASHKLVVNNIESTSTITSLDIGTNNSEPVNIGNLSGAITFGGTVYFPTIGGTPTGLNYYETGTFSATFSGPFASGQTLTVNFHRVGNQVTLTIPQLGSTAETSAAYALSSAEVPSRLRPTRSSVGVFTYGTDNSAAATLSMIVTTAGNIQFGVGDTPSTFTGTGNASWFETNITYIV